MRKTAAVIACIAAFAVLVPAFGAPDTVPPQSTVSPAADAAAGRAMRALSQAVPPVAPIPRPQTAPVAPTPGAPARTPAPALRPAALAHAVQSGETLWVISRRHGLSVEALAAANHLRLTAILQPGQTLVVPGAAGPKAAAPPPARAPRRAAPTTVHTVRSGETLWDIARRNDTQVEDLMALNDLGHSEWIKPGQRLLIAGSLPRSRRIGTQARSGSRVVMADASALRAAGTFLWPARGVLTSRFGRRWRTHHDGIDVAGPRGTPIYAARDGVVEDAGWMAGYGRAVRLGHGGGLTTMYGHASVLYVTPGQRVKKGQLIARVGCTGSCTGSHLHFEVRIGGHPVDPLRYLR